MRRNQMPVSIHFAVDSRHGELAELCRQIAAEQDSSKFLNLVERLSALLEERSHLAELIYLLF
jgi:hypothetical protein